MDCKGCGRPMFDGPPQQRYCEDCADRRAERSSIRDESGYERRLTEERARTAKDISRGYA